MELGYNVYNFQSFTRKYNRFQIIVSLGSKIIKYIVYVNRKETLKYIQVNFMVSMSSCVLLTTLFYS
jgi:hypothetical protein